MRARVPADDLIDRLRADIDQAYEAARPKIDRLFALEREANEDGDYHRWEELRNERSQAIYDLERATLPLKREIIRIAELIEAANPTPIRIELTKS